MTNFVLPEQLPRSRAELGALEKQAGLEIAVFQARRGALDGFTVKDVAQLKYLLAGRDKIRAVEASRLATHEAAHAVVAALTGGQVSVAELYPNGTDRDGALGQCQVVMTSLAVEQQQPLVAAAGAVAEAIWEHGSPTNYQVDAYLAGTPDGKFLRRWALMSGEPSTPPTAEVLPLLRRCWPAVESLAAQLVERREISHKHVVTALGLSNDHTRHPFELANIRAGMRGIPSPA